MICSLMTLTPVRSAGCQHGLTGYSGDAGHHKVGGGGGYCTEHYTGMFCAGPLPAGWSEGQLVWYGRAELKQSDHRPVLAVVDVQARVVDTVKREQVMYIMSAKIILMF